MEKTWFINVYMDKQTQIAVFVVYILLITLSYRWSGFKLITLDKRSSGSNLASMWEENGILNPALDWKFAEEWITMTDTNVNMRR